MVPAGVRVCVRVFWGLYPMEFLLLFLTLGLGFIFDGGDSGSSSSGSNDTGSGGGSAGGGGTAGGGAADPNADMSITGTDMADDITTSGGDDLVLGLSGADNITTGPGADIVDAGAGDDFVITDGGVDDVILGEGDDIAFLGSGDDISVGFVDVADAIEYGGDDEIHGGNGDDLIFDPVGANQLFGDAGEDTLNVVDQAGSKDEEDIVSGGDGDDIIFGDDGDMLSGDEGNDTFNLFFDEADDQAVILEDYVPGSEALTLEFDPSVFGTVSQADLSAEITEDTVELSVAGQVVAVLMNTTTFDPSMITVQNSITATG